MFWKTLNWIQDNWKSIALLGLPVLISFIASLIRENDSLENQLEMKEKEQKIDKEVSELGDRLKEEALEARTATIERVIDNHKDAMEAIAAAEEERIESIVDAEDATEAIKEKLEEPAWKKLTPDDIKPPRFPDPKKAANKRACPCGSGYKYKYCHAKYWSAE